MKCPHCGHKINVGSLMGSQRSKAKSAAAKANGAKGGRPRKTPKSDAPSEPANETSSAYSPMQTKAFIQRVAANTYHVQPMGSGPLKPAVVKANSAQEALTIYKREAKA